ncbi:SusC/RagA family TonB-linked outer membrane protein [Robertkochia solimangrovi]|uniref:SusC/RagA family TonB-linked outer membrane protein n=1 Tax=Robertkochia solimangrovi TaxID=2213046 RepID=UPI001180C82D|nr:SusC/RagA family TonB-linked outer membrane protein [Robertkochia solimangrovi]TRZ42241.1 SusC/RagA family TonB-linked outer membrane protein [Robertkochia solimangrovi]
MEIKFTYVRSLHRKRILMMIMRTFIFLFCTTVFGLTSGKTFSQTKVTIDHDEMVTVDEVFEIIREQTDYKFMYPKDLFKDLPKVQLKKGTIRVDRLLGQSITTDKFNLVLSSDNIIIVREKKDLQQIRITGTVSDQQGVPIPGVTVQIKGTTQGTVTDFDGTYAIEVSSTENVLNFSYLGYQGQEILVGNKTVIDVVLVEAVADLDEVVISTGYQEIKPEQVTGAVSTIQTKDYNSRINTTDFLTGLQNKIPGLLINNDIQFEGNSLFQIRGISTINGSRNPLIVIDGYPTELTLDNINPNDIESVTVLKDAAAATIYGVRASNGVIVIERKKAKAGKINVDFNSTFGFSPKENYDRYRWDKDASNLNIDFVRDTYLDNGSYLWNLITNPNASPDFNVDPITYILAQQSAGVLTDAEVNQRFAAMGAYNNTNEYSDLFLRTNAIQTYNLNMSGGSDKALYYLTVNHTNTDQSQIKNDNSTFMITGRATLKFSDRFSLDVTNNFQQAKTSSVPIPDITDIYAFEHFQDEAGNALPTYYNSNANPWYNDYLISQGLLDNQYYPLEEIDLVSTKTQAVNNRFVANFRYELNDALSFSFGGVYETSRTDTRYLSDENSAETRQLINYYTSDDGNGGFTYNLPKGSILRQSTTSAESYTLRAQMNYNEQFNEDHSINLILGGEVRDVLEKGNSAAYFGYNDQNLLQQPVDNTLLDNSYNPTYARNNPSLSYNSLFDLGYVDNRFISVYSNIVYAYKGKYSVTGSIRIDQSNLFGTDPKYKYKPLWSVGAAWNIDKENFMQDISWLNSLKIRAAYGFNGNVAKNSLPQVIAEAGYNRFDPSRGLMLSLLSPANSGLRWEQTSNFNLGLDYDLFRNVSGSIEYYTKKSTDLLATNQIDATKGQSSAYVNQATIRNSGWEFSLGADWITKQRFNWNTGFNISYNTSEVLAVSNELTSNSLSSSYLSGSATDFIEGYAIGSMFNYRYAGIDDTGAPLIYDSNGNAKTIYTDDAGILDVDYVGSSIPTYNMGISNRVDIGDFYAYCMINFYGGFKTRVPVPYVGDVRPLEGAGNYWLEPGDENNPDVLPMLNTSYYTNLGYTDKYTVNGAYITLGDLTAAYSFRNSGWLRKTGIQNFEVRVQGSNLYTLGFNKFNFSQAVGAYEKSYLTPTYTIGLNINF